MTCPRMFLGFIALSALPLEMPQAVACPFCDALAQINGAAAAGGGSDEDQQLTEPPTIESRVRAEQAKPEKLASDLTALFGKVAKGSITIDGDVLMIRGSKDFVEIAEQKIKKFDTAQAPPRTRQVYRLTDATARTSAEIVGRLFPESEVMVVAEESSNSLIVSCLEKRADEVSKLIQALDLAEKHENETRKEKESMAANRIRELQVQLAELETHYSSRHPKVVSLRQELQLLQAFEREAAAIDEQSSPELTVHRLQHADAAEVAIALEKLFRGETVRIAADSRANAILIRGSQKMCEQILDLVESLDQDSREASVESANRKYEYEHAVDPELDWLGANRDFWGIEWERVKGLDIDGLRQFYSSLERDAAKIASDCRKQADDEYAPLTRMLLEGTVKRAFAARQRLQAMEVEQYRERLSQIEARIRRRELLKDRIISKRIEDLLNPELQWNNRSPGNLGRSDQAARSSTDNGAAGSVSAMEQTLVPRSLSQVGGGVERRQDTDRGPYFVTQVTGAVPEKGAIYVVLERQPESKSQPRNTQNIRQTEEGLDNPGGKQLSAPVSTTTPVGFRQLIAGRWVLVSADKDGETFRLESTAAEDPFAAQEDDGKTSSSFKTFSRFASAVFGDDHVLFGPHWNQTGEQWKYAIESETDPRRITLTEGDKTIKGIIWAWKRQMVISLAEDGGDFPKDFDSKGNLVLRYERDETDPQWLRSEVARLRDLATNLVLHGNDVQQKTAREIKDLADSVEREEKLYEQVYAATSRANELRKSGRLQQAKSLENEAAELRGGLNKNGPHEWPINVSANRRSDSVKGSDN